MRNGINAAALARDMGVTTNAVVYRLNKGQSVEQIRLALSDPTRKRGPGRAPYITRPDNAERIKQGMGGMRGIRGADGFANYQPAVLNKNRSVGSKLTVAPGTGAGAVPPVTSNPSARSVQLDRDFATPADARAELTYETAAVNRSEAERRLSLAKAEKEELLVAQRKGELIEYAAVRSFIADMIARAQDMLLRIPAETRDRIAAETDPVKVGELLDFEIRRALEKLRQVGEPDRGASLDLGFSSSTLPTTSD